MYRINQDAILVVKFGFFLGVPLLSSFVLQPLASYRFIAVVLILAGYWLNNLYPDRIEVRAEGIAIKLLLSREWIEIPSGKLAIEAKPHYLVLHSQNKAAYRISAKRLSVRLYKQLEPYFSKGGWNDV